MSRALNNFFSFANVQDGTNYAAGVETQAENLIESNEQDAVIVYPSKDGWATPRSDAYKMTTENAEWHLPYPIYKVNKVLVKFQDSTTYAGTKIVDFKASDGEALETLDITKYIVTSDEWGALEIAKEKNGYLNGIYKDNTFFWEKASKKIPLLATEYVRGTTILGGMFADQSPTYKRLIVSALATTEKDYVYTLTNSSGTTTVSLKHQINSYSTAADGLSNFDIRNLQFRIEYVPLVSAYKMRARKANFGLLDYMQPFNQRAEINDSTALGKNMFYTAQKTGVQTVSVSKNYEKWEQIPKVGDLARHKGKIYRIIANEYKMTNTVFLTVTHVLSENWTSKSKHVAVNQKYRNYKIPQDILWRNLHWENYAILSFEMPSQEPAEKDFPSNTEFNCLCKDNTIARHAFKILDYRKNVADGSVFADYDYEDKQIQYLFWKFNDSVTQGEYQAVVLPCSTYGMANSIVVSAQFKDQLSAGITRMSQDMDTTKCEEALYCNKDGTLGNAKVMLTSDISAYEEINNSGAYIAGYEEASALALPAAMYNAAKTGNKKIILNYPEGVMFNETFNVLKDAGEALKFTYQLHFMPKDPDIIIGQALTENNTLIHKDTNAGNANGFRKHSIFFSKKKFRPGEEKLSDLEINNEKIIEKDVDNHAKDRRLEFNFENNEAGGYYGKSIAKFGLSEWYFNQSILNGNYKYWAIADENDNLLVACNREYTRLIYGWVAERLYRPHDYEYNPANFAQEE